MIFPPTAFFKSLAFLITAFPTALSLIAELMFRVIGLFTTFFAILVGILAHLSINFPLHSINFPLRSSAFQPICPAIHGLSAIICPHFFAARPPPFIRSFPKAFAIPAIPVIAKMISTLARPCS